MSEEYKSVNEIYFAAPQKLTFSTPQDKALADKMVDDYSKWAIRQMCALLVFQALFLLGVFIACAALLSK